MKPTFFAAPEKFRDWLAKKHTAEVELLVGFWKLGTGKPSLTWSESVDEALSYGWIDGVRSRIDDDAYSIRFTPRKPTSIWSAVNVAKVAKLTKEGRMQPAGILAFAKRRADRTAVYAFERVEDAKLELAHEERLRANAKASAFFDAQPPSYRRVALHWIVGAKRGQTREKRFATLLADSAAGRRLAHLTVRSGAPSKVRRDRSRT